MTKGNKVYSVVPKKRGIIAELLISIFAIIFLLIGCYLIGYNNWPQYLFLSSSFYLLIIIFINFLKKCALFCEEINHLDSRVKIMSIVSFILSFFIGHSNIFEILNDFGLFPNLCALISCMFFGQIIQLDDSPVDQAILMEKLGGLDYGVSMAYSYYTGFLQIVLPNKGTEQKGFKELMKDFESNNNIKFSYRKLIVLVPMSLYCPANLEDHSKIIHLAQSLGEIKVSRGGVHERIYKNTVYKIEKNGERFYVCAEYATPLRTLEEIIKNSNNKHANIYNLHKNELVIQFYQTLNDILNNSPETQNLCDLVLFDDYHKNRTKLRDVGEVILNYIKNQK